MTNAVFDHHDHFRTPTPDRNELRVQVARFHIRMADAINKGDGDVASLYASWIFSHERELEFRGLHPEDVSAE